MVIQDNIGTWINFTANIYQLFNGSINTVLISNQLKFGEPNRKTKNFILGASIVDEIVVNILDIAEYCNKYKIYDENQIRGILIFVVLHELSHCDQDINFLESKNDHRKKLKYELENDLYTIKFINENKDFIFKECGSFDQDIMSRLIHWNRFQDNKLTYNKIKCVPDKIVRILSSITDEYLEKIIIQKKIQNIILSYSKLNQYNEKIEIDIMKYGTWLYIPLQILREISYNLQLKSRIIYTDECSIIIDIQQKDQNREYPMYIDYQYLKM